MDALSTRDETPDPVIVAQSCDLPRAEEELAKSRIGAASLAIFHGGFFGLAAARNCLMKPRLSTA